MATEKTNFTNVVTESNENSNEAGTNQNKSNVPYDNTDFDGTEAIKWQPTPFIAFGKTTRVNSAELAHMISTEFKKTFHDLRGCNIIALPNNQFAVELYFEQNTEPLPEGKIINLKSMIDPVNTGDNNLYYRQQVVQNRKSGRTFTLNNETRLLLSRFMYGGKNANKPNDKKWNSEAVVKEIHIPANDPYMYRGRNIERAMLRVTNLDLRRILQELYGHDMVFKTVADADGDMNYRSIAYYEPRFIKANTDGTFIMNIEQFDKKEVENIITRENPIPQYAFLGVRMY
jgi:hypothetical protein